MVLEAHGGCVRMAADLLGEHFQGLAALAAHLRRRGCRDRRLLRRLGSLDAACAVLRHITVVSVEQMYDDLAMACDAVVPKDPVASVEPFLAERVATNQFKDLAVSVVPHVEGCVETNQFKDPVVSEEPCLEACLRTNKCNVDPAAAPVKIKEVRAAPQNHMVQELEGDEEMQASQKKLLLAKWQARMAGRMVVKLGGISPGVVRDQLVESEDYSDRLV